MNTTQVQKALKTPYIVEAELATGGWHKVKAHKTLDAAIKHRNELCEVSQRDYRVTEYGTCRVW